MSSNIDDIIEEISIDKKVKILIIGDSGVGKSSFLSRYTDSKFNTNHIITMGIEFKYRLTTHYSNIFQIMLWDTSGQKIFSHIIDTYLKGLDGIIIMYDVTNRSSFINISKWMDKIKLNSNTSTNVILIGNKIDCGTRYISSKEGENMGLKLNIPHSEISCKKDINVKESVHILLDNIIESKNIEKTNYISNSDNSDYHTLLNNDNGTNISKCNRIKRFFKCW
jgi:small GTP-binding protein